MPETLPPIASALPRIALPSTMGEPVVLAEVPGFSIVAIYPWTGRPGHPNPPDWDDIPGAHGSTPELEGFRDLAPEFAALGVRLYGLSGQETDWQREMATRLGLPFPILSDAEGTFANGLALPSFETGGVKYLKRLSILARDGKIGRLFYPVERPGLHPRDVLQWLRARRMEC